MLEDQPGELHLLSGSEEDIVDGNYRLLRLGLREF